MFIGASPHGQGEETTFAQIVADELGVDVNDVKVVHGDTDVTPMGWGTYGSRTTAVGGAALVRGGAQDQGQSEARWPRICSKPPSKTSITPTASSS